MFNFRCIKKLLQYLKFFIFLIIENIFCVFSFPKKYFAGEIVLITGSANGIGRQVALKLAPLGVTLVLWDIDDEGNKETSRLAQQNGASRVFVYHCDCSRREDIYEQADKVRKEVGDVTILINNAGILIGKKFCELTDEDFEKTFRINLFSQVWTCKAFLPAMVACNRGHLVSTASAAGVLGLYRLSDYSASQSAIIAMMEAINSELYHGGKRGIKITIICPYFISTRLSKGFKSTKPCLFPVYDPEYAASRIVDAIKKEKHYLIMPPAVYLLGLKIFLPRKAALFLESYVKFPESMEEAFGQKKKD
ncbi:LOW QUALITY PROTEIN: epidermal retinol dehydrogenase 2-like [Pyrgilauda ruficollis]|uniref:LOW QUALITY PROTEIN: epidermal retinol dehydrogenase 2-like n=1 Tax=Pyrgilauda ruficollis TaxID=221976 RepID=UPI001B86C24A|nr:LOW QUALITY PROTEIN: epidermal retinol dehydrogenase 2-like [Pyrgilauda ruficollis]